MIPARLPRPLLPCLLLLSALPLGAQSPGTIEGTVKYRSGVSDERPAGFVTVYAEFPDRDGRTELALTNGDGYFRFLTLEPGAYRIYAIDHGWHSEATISLELSSRQILKIALVLIPDTKQVEDVVVEGTGRGELPDIKNTSNSRTLRREELDRLPLLNTSIQSMLTHMEGVVQSGGADSDEIEIGGGTSDEIRINMDGTQVNDPLTGRQAGHVPSTAIEELELIRGGFQAEYGTAASAIVNVRTRRGTNARELLFSSTWRNPQTACSRLGPLDGVTETWNRLLNAERFPAAYDLLLSGLGELPSRTSDDSNPAARNRVEHQVGVGGPIAEDRLFFFSNLSALTNDFGNPFDTKQRREDLLSWFGKLTWEISPGHTFWTDLNVSRRESSGGDLPQVSRESTTENTEGNWLLSAHHVYPFKGPGWRKGSFLETNASWNHIYGTRRAISQDADRQVNILLPPAGVAALSTKGPASGRDYTVDDFRFVGSWSKGLRRHNIKTGGELGHQALRGVEERYRIFNDYRVMFTSGFGSSAGALPGSLGLFVNPGPEQRLNESARLASVYVQDTWELTDSLLIEPGIRLDWQSFVGRVLVAPRFGFSLIPAGNKKMQILGSYGHFYQNLFLEAVVHDLRPGQTVFDVLPGPEATARTVGFDVIGLDDLVEASSRTEIGSDALARLFPRVRQVFDIDDRLTAPRNEQWTVRLRRLLSQNVVLDLAYTEADRENVVRTTTDTLDVGAGLNEPPAVNVLFSTTGHEEVQQWVLSLHKQFDHNWLLNASYTQQKVLGPQNQVADPLDPLRVQSTFGVLDRDRTEIIQLSASGPLPWWGLQLATSFRYQTGVPVTPTAYEAGIVNVSDDPANPILVTQATTSQPLGVNSLRLPPERRLDVSVSRSFRFKRIHSMEARLSVFNLTNEFNVLSGLGTFGDLGDPNPLANPPLEPGMLPLTADIPRTVQLEFRLRL